MINTVLFDMDGLLIDSEPFWRKAMKACFASVGITLTEDLCRLTMGKKTSEVIQYWYSRQPWENKTLVTLENELVSTVQNLVMHEGVSMPGVNYILDFFKEKNFKLGLASSSASRLIETVLTKLNLKDYFEIAHSAEFEALGKPHPAVFLTAAEKIGSGPKQCLVFEDSFNGMLAAKAAGMKVIVVPEKDNFSDPVFDVADRRLASLLDFDEDNLTLLNNN
jgi:beta-phosphoglucomutase-like phosphatase (HAD superfamily)